MTKRVLFAALAGALALTATPSASLVADAPRELSSLPGQVTLVTVNARQNRILAVSPFKRLLTMAEGLRSRPSSFNGGYGGAVTAPDVILVQEMRSSNVEILQKLLNQRFRDVYRTVGAPDSNRKFIFNSSTLSLQGEVTEWPNPCRTGDDGELKKYLRALFIERATNLTFTVVGVHFPKKNQCRQENIELMRAQLASEAGPIIIGGDFNQRPVRIHRECDSDERSEPVEWYATMTQPSDGTTAYIDAVRNYNRRSRQSMVDEWTYERNEKTELCHGARGYQRARIDYLFTARTVVAEAHADHPGWAGVIAGTRHPTNKRYSDHRWVWGRFVLAGPVAPKRPTPVPDKGGVIHLSWEPVDGAIGYVLYRAVQGHAYSVLARPASGTSTYDDGSTRHGRKYRYAVAGVDATGSQGLESRPRWMTADARGPRVTSISPQTGAVKVKRNATIRVRFDEPVDPASVKGSTIELRRKGNWIRGRVFQESRRVLVFNPKRWLRNKTYYRVVVRAVSDKLGNLSERFYSNFRT